ncbi:hypothetical protein [Stenomitos frigidus]|uniref:Uncharacterized protein n=1 Tax=Stenomitos frigidus ULC18 TaxID=2107698 RepID=A0A2T1EAW7_9CYAN|nr:hypothetical protein [Stenomitos frigidus]PSB29906.1 hypothetical protein C7B82_10155 [Stenomitos frigidus ULC18]
MVSFASPGLIGGPRTTTVSQIGGLTAAGQESNALEGQLQILKLKQALAAAQSGQSADNSPAGLQAARLKAALDQQQVAATAASGRLNDTNVAQRDLQNTRLAVQRDNLGMQLASQRASQGDRIQSTEKVNTQNLAAQLQRQQVGIQGQKDVQTNASGLEEQRRKDAAVRALALFNGTPGGANLNMAAARAQLG